MGKLLTLLILLLAAATSDAHEKWFIESRPYPIQWNTVFQGFTPIFILGVVALVGLLGLVWRKRGRSFLPGPEQLGATASRRVAVFSVIPLLLALHLAVPMLVNGVSGHLFSPDNHLESWARYWLGVAQCGIALALFYGAITRVAGALLVLLWFIGLFVFGYEPMLDNALYLGFGLFFVCAGRGPISIDRMLFPRLEPSPELMRKALTIARVGVGLSLTFVAFSEKLANMPLATAFLNEHQLNFTAALGIPMSNQLFVLCAGSVELLAGLLILFGIFPREIALVAWLPINMTLIIFNWSELIGHLPIYGMLAVLVIWTPNEENLRLWVEALRGGPFPTIEKEAGGTQGTASGEE